MVAVVNPLGLHQRVADRFCRDRQAVLVQRHGVNGERRADGKNIWDLIGCSCFPGTEVVLEVEGPDAATASSRWPVSAAPGGEDYTI